MSSLRCSFCGRRETEVAKLVAGTGGRGTRPRVYICDRCVEKASDILTNAESTGSDIGGGSTDNSPPWDES